MKHRIAKNFFHDTDYFSRNKNKTKVSNILLKSSFDEIMTREFLTDEKHISMPREKKPDDHPRL